MTGIYFLIQRNHIVYIGQSINLERRLSNHRSKIKFDNHRFIQCRFQDLDYYEQRWVQKFKPMLNGTHYKKGGKATPGSKKFTRTGRKPGTDNKIAITIYVPKSQIEKVGGFDTARELALNAVIK